MKYPYPPTWADSIDWVGFQPPLSWRSTTDPPTPTPTSQTPIPPPPHHNMCISNIPHFNPVPYSVLDKNLGFWFENSWSPARVDPDDGAGYPRTRSVIGIPPGLEHLKWSLPGLVFGDIGGAPPPPPPVHHLGPGGVSEWVIKFYGLSRTADSEVHIVHISRVIIACTLKSLSSPT